MYKHLRRFVYYATHWPCKVCGRRGTTLWPSMHALPLVYELLCWPCVYWLQFGKIYDVR